MRYAQIRKMDISNGEGVGVSLFVQGCHFHCKNCFNPETWDFNGGKLFTKKEEEYFINIAKRPYIDFISILGGEPLAQYKDDTLLNLLKRIKNELPDKKIYMWTGFIFESLNEKQKEILSYIDILIDGQFVDELKDFKLKLRGSSNQRIIDVKKSLKEDKVCVLNFD